MESGRNPHPAVYLATQTLAAAAAVAAGMAGNVKGIAAAVAAAGMAVAGAPGAEKKGAARAAGQGVMCAMYTRVRPLREVRVTPSQCEGPAARCVRTGCRAQHQ